MTTKSDRDQACYAQANGIELCYECVGDPDAPPLLLIAGLGMQLTGWEDEFCEALTQRGYRVIRYDNRDAGLSTKFDQAGTPGMLGLLQARSSGKAPYLLNDMADDAAALLDALGILSAHVVGVSMGGMIAQALAIRHPDKVRTLTSIMSTTGDPALPPPTPAALALLTTAAPRNREQAIQAGIKSSRVLQGPKYPLDEEKAGERAARAYDRSPNTGGMARQLAAILASGSRKEALSKLDIPTLVIHGDADPLLPVEHGKDTARTIPGAKLMILEGVGHALPPEVASKVIEAIAEHAR